MKKLLLFAGLPGVGKSTLSKAMGEITGAKIVALDDFKKTTVNQELVKHQIDPPELRWSYYQKALHHVFRLFDQGTPIVIMDEVFHLSSLRTQLETLCALQNIRVLWFEVRCSYPVVKERLQSSIRESHILSTEEALKMHVMFTEIFESFPIGTKNHIVVNNEKQTNVVYLVNNFL